MNHLDHLIIKLQAAMGFKTSDESHLELLKSYNAELRRSPERFSSADVWTEWNRAVHGIVEQLNGVQKDLIDGQTSNSEVQVLSQYLQIARNLCAGGAHHQKSLSVFIPDLIQPTLDATVRISGIPSLRADALACFRMSLQMLSNLMTGNSEVILKIWPYLLQKTKLIEHITILDEPSVDRIFFVLILNCTAGRKEETRLFVDHVGHFRNSVTRTTVDRSQDEFNLIMAIWRNALVLDEVPRLLGELNNEDHENCLFIVHEIVQKETLNGWNLSETLSWTIGVTKEVVERVNIGSPETLKTVPWLLGILNQFTMTGDVPLNKKIGIDLDIVSVMLCLLGKLKQLPKKSYKDPAANVSEYTLVKSDAVKLLGNLSFECKAVQDKIGNLQGLPLILECCQIDDENPFLKEVSVFAIRNLCAGHPVNQALIDELKPIQVVQNDMMDDLQIKGVIENGLVKIQSHLS